MAEENRRLKKMFAEMSMQNGRQTVRLRILRPNGSAKGGMKTNPMHLS